MFRYSQTSKNMNISNKLVPIEAFKVSGLDELFSIILHDCLADKWFRGQADIDYPLLPSVLRRAHIVKDQFGRPVKPKPLTIFSTHSDECIIPDAIYLSAFMDKLKEESLYDAPILNYMNDINFICMAQHYGVRTRLLDWTTDAIVALFFALDGRDEGKSAGFYILDPVKLNEGTNGECKVYRADEAFIPDSFPIAFYGPKNDMRMCRQSGNFTIFGDLIWPIDYMYCADDFLKRIEIPNSVCHELQNFIRGFGITKESIYVMNDEKDRIAQEARELTEKNLNYN